MNLLIVSPHPDDETLGAGGTLLKYRDIGHKTYWLNMTNMKEEFDFPKAAVRRRQKEMKKAAAKYRFQDVFDFGLKPAALDDYKTKDLINKISGVFNKVKPAVVILPFRGDVHTDHRITFEAAFSCTKVFRYPFVKQVMMMEVISETDFTFYSDIFSPNYFVDIGKYIDEKVEIAKMYKGELGSHPFARSEAAIRSLAAVRGAQSGVKSAEAFSILKMIAQ